MHFRIYKFFEKCDILHSLQFGFCSKHSTLHALINMTEPIKNRLMMVFIVMVFSMPYKKPLIL